MPASGNVFGQPGARACALEELSEPGPASNDEPLGRSPPQPTTNRTAPTHPTKPPAIALRIKPNVARARELVDRGLVVVGRVGHALPSDGRCPHGEADISIKMTSIFN